MGKVFGAHAKGTCRSLDISKALLIVHSSVTRGMAGMAAAIPKKILSGHFGLSVGPNLDVGPKFSQPVDQFLAIWPDEMCRIRAEKNFAR